MTRAELIPIRDVVEGYIGGGWGRDTPDSAFSEPAWVIRGTDFPPVQIGDVSSCPHRFHKPSNLRSRRLQDGDIVLEVSGGSKDQPVGRAILVDAQILGRFDGDVIPASFCKLVRPVRSRVDSRYLAYFLKWLYDTREIMQFQVQSTGISNFQFENFLDGQLIQLWPLSIQRKIAAILSAYDDLIENDNRRIKILEETAQRIYREWFVEFRYPGHEDVGLVDSDFGPLPANWGWHELRQLASESRVSVSPSSVEPDTPYVGLEHMPPRSIALSEWGVARDAASQKYRYEVGQILFGRIRPYFHKVVVPSVAGICSTDAIVIKSHDDTYWGLVLAVVSSDAFIEQAVQTSQGTKMPRANWKVLEGVRVPIPPTRLLAAFDDHIKTTVRLIQNLVVAFRTLRASRDLLLPRLISGEIDVTDLDIGVPVLVA
jgi:type I restriction enzyme S subunit